MMEMLNTTAPHMTHAPRPLRSFGRVKGRKLTDYQQHLLDELLPQHRIVLPAKGDMLDSASLRQGYQRIMLEIGFGAGEHLVSLAERYPDMLCIGAEPFLNGVAKCLVAMQEKKLENILLHPTDVQHLLDALPDGCLERIDILFPDPWRKRAHHNRRIVNPVTLSKCARVLKPQGILWLATDHTDYAAWMRRHLQETTLFHWQNPESAQWHNPPEDWHPTRYQQKAAKQGVQAQFYCAIKQSS